MTDEMLDPCDCGLPDCNECQQQILDQEDESERAEEYEIMAQEDEAQLDREMRGDDDDGDEEDPHGSHPIGDPDYVDEENDEDDEN